MRLTKTSRSIILSLSLLLSLLLLSACVKADSKTAKEGFVTVPELINVELTEGKSELTTIGLLPVVEYEFSDSIQKDRILRVNPSAGSDVDKNSKITVYVSKGPSLIKSKDAAMQFYNITSQRVEWKYNTPYISENVLYIEFSDLTFGTAIEWEDRYDEGSGFGLASINDTFDKVVPVDINHEKKSFDASEAQSFIISIPLSDLAVEKPTDLYLQLAAKVDGNNEDIRINFKITW